MLTLKCPCVDIDLAIDWIRWAGMFLELLSLFDMLLFLSWSLLDLASIVFNLNQKVY
jgi:hypothetical protein